ncbi:hypothetical protein KJ765_00970 [Candidatus Micrarchaeota archaeon]|nr:hypothetical protein [Candidatus Micrarchaeota archaeon]
MGTYFSTSRRPSQLTRRIVRKLAYLLQGKYENRGKRSGEELAERAQHFGFSRVCFLYEKNGNPSEMQFFDVEKGWLEEKVRVLGVREFERNKRAPKELLLKAHDAAGKKMKELFMLEDSEVDGLEEEEAVVVEMNAQRIALKAKGEAALELRVKLEKA